MVLFPNSGLLRAGAAALFVLCGAAGSAVAAPVTDGGSNERDPVSGYLCLDATCAFVRMNEANCICQKMNPNEQVLSRLKLKCSTTENWTWVACPVPPKYGIPVQ